MKIKITSPGATTAITYVQNEYWHSRRHTKHDYNQHNKINLDQAARVISLVVCGIILVIIGCTPTLHWWWLGLSCINFPSISFLPKPLRASLGTLSFGGQGGGLSSLSIPWRSDLVCGEADLYSSLTAVNVPRQPENLRAALRSFLHGATQIVQKLTNVAEVQLDLLDMGSPWKRPMENTYLQDLEGAYHWQNGIGHVDIANSV